MPNHPNRSKRAHGVATRNLVNEFGHDIAIFVQAGPPGKNIFCRTTMRGQSSIAQNNMTRMELENLRDAIVDALSADPSSPREC